MLIMAGAVTLGLSLNMFHSGIPLGNLATRVAKVPEPGQAVTAENHPEVEQASPMQETSGGRSPAPGANPESGSLSEPASKPGPGGIPVSVAEGARASDRESQAPGILRKQPEASSSFVVVISGEKDQAIGVGRRVATGIEAAAQAPAVSAVPPIASVQTVPQPGAPPSPAAAAVERPTDVDKPNQVRGVQFVDTPSALEVVIVTRNPVECVRFFHSKGPARLAVDLPGVWQDGVAQSIPARGDLLERVRVGVHPDKLRLVMDYKDQDRQDLSDPVIEKRTNGLLIKLEKVAGKR